MRILASVVVGILLTFQVGILFYAIPTLGLKGALDFRTLYAAGYMVRTGHARQLHNHDADREFQKQSVGASDAGNHYNHLAYESLFFVPFSLLSYRAAYFAFLGLNIVLLVISYRLMRPYLGLVDHASAFLSCAPFLAFFPVTSALAHGQVSVILLALFVAAMILYNRGNEMTAGALVGITLFKFQYGLPFVLLFLIWRRYRFVAGFAISGLVVLALSLSLIGFAGFNDYLHDLASTSSEAGMQRYSIPPERMPNIRGLIYTLGIGRLSETTLLIATAICSAAVLFWASRRRPDFSLAVTAAFLVSYHGLIPDATLLVIPLSLAIGSGLNGSMRRPAVCLLLVAIIVAAPTLLNLYGTRFYLMTFPIVIFFGLTSLPPDGRCQTAPTQNRNLCPAANNTRRL
jgi:Glycosyltransferase family 87